MSLSELHSAPSAGDDNRGSKHRKEKWGYLAAAATVTVWSAAFPLISIALKTFNPIELASIRFGLAALLAAAWLIARECTVSEFRDFLNIALCSLLGIALYNWLLNTGETRVSANVAGFVINCTPIITALLAHITAQDRLSWVGWLGSALAFAGVGLLIATQEGGIDFQTGGLWVLGASVCQATYFVALRPLIIRFGALDATALIVASGGLLLSPWFFQALAAAQREGLTVQSVASLTALVLGPTLVGNVTWMVVLNTFGAGRAATFLYFGPPTIVGMTLLLTGESPNQLMLLNGAIILAGVILVGMSKRTISD